MARSSWSVSRIWSTGLLLVSLMGVGCRGGASVLADLDHARSLAADLRLQFDKVDKASSQAVMADTDEASITFAKEAQQATARATSDVTTLRPLLKNLGYSRELGDLDAFQSEWAKYERLDRDILALAVENTNLKAQRLSFGPAREAADSFRDAVSSVAAGIPAKERCSGTELAQTALLSVREIQVLQAPHIAEADDAAMARLEHDMAALDQKAGSAVKALADLAGAAAGTQLTQATAALARFKEVSAQLVALSRRNTNVRSLALSLREQPTLAAACDERLRSLQQTLDSEGSKATR